MYQELVIRPGNFGPGGNCQINEDGSGLTFFKIEPKESPAVYTVDKTFFYKPYGSGRLERRVGLHYVRTPNDEALLALTQDYKAADDQYKAELLRLTPTTNTRLIQSTIWSLGASAQEAFREYLNS